MRRPVILLGLCSFFLCAVEATAAVYSITDLGTLDGPNVGWSQALGLNDKGQVVGLASVGQDVHAFLYSNGNITDLGVLAGNHHWSQAAAVNNSGTAVGMSTTSASVGQAFRPVMFAGSSVTYLGDIGSNLWGSARGINNSGQIVGISSNYHAFLWSSGTMTDINYPPVSGGYSDAYDINDQGQVVGNFWTGTQDGAFIWDPATGMSALDNLAGMTQSRAYKINNHGQIVGESFLNAAPGEYSSGDAVLWDNGTVTDLGTFPGRPYSIAFSINDSGVVVGGAYSMPILDATATTAVVWDKTNGLQNLNGMLDGSGVGWTLSMAHDINNLGQITGWGFHDGELHSFLMTPVPEPSTLAIFGGLGAMGLIAAWRKRRPTIHKESSKGAGHRLAARMVGKVWQMKTVLAIAVALAIVSPSYAQVATQVPGVRRYPPAAQKVTPGDEVELNGQMFCVVKIIDKENLVATVVVQGWGQGEVWLKYPTQGLEEKKDKYTPSETFVVIGTKEWEGHRLAYLCPKSKMTKEQGTTAPKLPLTPKQTSSPAFRTWTDSTGEHKVAALLTRFGVPNGFEIVNPNGEGWQPLRNGPAALNGPADLVVTLIKEDGTILRVPAEKLSKADLVWIEKLSEKGQQKREAEASKRNPVENDPLSKEEEEEKKERHSFHEARLKDWQDQMKEWKVAVRNRSVPRPSPPTKPKMPTPAEWRKYAENRRNSAQAESNRDKHDLGCLGGSRRGLPPWNTGDYGRFCGGKCKIIQIVDEHNVLCEIAVDSRINPGMGAPEVHASGLWMPGYHMENIVTETVWIKMNTAGMVDGQIHETKDVFTVTGTKQYQALIGTKTVYVLEKR